MTEKTFEEETLNIEKDEETEPEPTEEAAPEETEEEFELDFEEMKAAALAYAKYLRANGMIPGELSFGELEKEEETEGSAEAAPETEPEPIETETTEETEPEEPAGDAEEEGSEDESGEETAEERASEDNVTEADNVAEDEIPEETEPEEPAGDAEEVTPEENADESVSESTEEEASEETAGEAEAETAEDAASENTAEVSEAAPEEKPEEEKPESEEKKQGSGNKESKERKRKQKARVKRQKAYKNKFMKNSGRSPLASITELHDRVQDGVDETFAGIGRDIVRGAHRISDGYMESRRVIGLALLLTGILVAAILIIFDRFTVYEYAYNGKVLGYVQEQEEVTDVLALAGKKLSGEDDNGVDVEFVANQNVTFNLVDSRGKSTDDSDTVINKLIYMTDLETEAYAVCDGDRIVAIVKDQNDAEDLLTKTMADLSVPDRGMSLLSAEFTNNLSVKPVNVLLGSIQSNAAAREQMANGGEMETFHIAEEGETSESIAKEFGVETTDIYDERNRDVVEEIEQGDKVCIRNTVEPVSVKMVETGRLKEVLEFETIKKETDEYYKGDTHLQQDGVNGVQIFEGTITKVGGVETDRDPSSEPLILQEKRDKIILVGTAERPKTAATGTFIKPLDHFTMTSGFGPRWGTHHDGVDLAISTGTPFYAADGGTVVRAGWYGGYGMCIDIDHGNGYVTRYGHCSQILVSVGDLVYQGQNIGLVGSTGWSTGPHLHFEVHKDGVRQDPEAYVRFY